MFGEPDGLHLRPTRLDDPRERTEAVDGSRRVVLGDGIHRVQGVLQRITSTAAAASSWIEQGTRLSVLNTEFV